MPRYAIYVDVSRCIGCYACIVACNNSQGEEVARIRIVDIVDGKYPDITRWIFPVMCMQCKDAPCIQRCPEEAIRKRDDGIVWIDEDKCIGCGECIDVCPYEAILLDEAEGKSKKCDFCLERIDKGINPSCVDACPTDALVFGNLDDPKDKISRLIASKKPLVLLPDKAREVNVFYQAFPELNDIALATIKSDS